YRTAQSLSRTGSFRWRVATGEISWSEETFRIFELDRSIRPSLAFIVERTHPDDVGRTKALIERVMRDGGAWTFEHRLCLPSGVTKHVRVSGRPGRDVSGGLEYVGAIMDVTASRAEAERLQASLEEKDALLREVHHRVKNNLQLISSLLNLQAARVDEPSIAEIFADSRNRVRSMALVHENLYRAGN